MLITLKLSEIKVQFFLHWKYIQLKALYSIVCSIADLYTSVYFSMTH